MTRRSIEVAPGVDLSIIEGGSRSSEPSFVLVHGLASNALTWDGVAAALAAAGSHSISVDQRGHGESSKPSAGFDFETITTDIATLIEAERLGPVVIAGQSWGGNVAVEFSRRHAVLCAAVVCVDGGFIRIADRFPDWDEAARQLAPPDFSELTMNDLDAMAETRFAEWPQSGVAGQLANFELVADERVRPRLSRANHLRILSALWKHDPDSFAGELSAPVLVIAVGKGEADKRNRVEAFVERLPIGELVWVEGDHDIHAQQPELVAGLMLSFVDGVV